MRKLAFVVAAASLFAIAPVASRFGPVGSSIALVWLGVLLAVFASGSFHSLAVAAGAAGAFGSGVLGAASPAAAGAVLVAAAFAERTTRVRNRTSRAVHVLLALASGAIAGSLSSAFQGSSLAVFGVSVVVAAVLAALPLLVDADDPVAHALDQAAKLTSEPARSSLASGAELRRQAQEVPLDRTTAARVKTTWQSLLRLAEARIRLERRRPQIRIAPAAEGGAPAPKPTTADAVLTMLDQRIADHVSVLGRAYTAVDTAHAATLGLDDTALKNVASMGDALDVESAALVEVRDAAGAGG